MKELTFRMIRTVAMWTSRENEKSSLRHSMTPEADVQSQLKLSQMRFMAMIQAECKTHLSLVIIATLSELTTKSTVIKSLVSCCYEAFDALVSEKTK